MGGRGASFNSNPITGRLDFSNNGTYNFNGQRAPEDLERFTNLNQGQGVGPNPTTEFRGTQYTVQAVIGWDSDKMEPREEGSLYVPYNTLEKGSFFVSNEGRLYHDATQYLTQRNRRRR